MKLLGEVFANIHKKVIEILGLLQIMGYESPITVTNTDLPIVVELVEVQIDANDNPLWSVEYKELYQGRVNCDEYENEGPYLTLRSALMNAFNDNFAFIILGYIITLINTVDCICLIAMQETINSTFGIVEY